MLAKEPSRLEKRSVEIEEILGYLIDKKGPIIVLIDLSKKNTYPDSDGVLGAVSHMTSTAFASSSYLGHYLLLIGCSEDRVFYLDPNKAGLQSMSVVNFEVSRKAVGTDEDLIFLMSL